MEGLYKKTKVFSERLGTFIQYVTVAIIVFLLILSIAQVFLRSFNLPQMGVEELMQFPVIWMYMLGGACASFSKSHIECGILDSFIKSKKVLDIIAIFKTVLSFLINCITTKWAYDFLMYSIKINKISVILGIPWVAANVSVVVGLILMAFFTVVEIIERICLYMNPDEEEVRVCR